MCLKSNVYIAIPEETIPIVVLSNRDNYRVETNMIAN